MKSAKWLTDNCRFASDAPGQGMLDLEGDMGRRIRESMEDFVSNELRPQVNIDRQSVDKGGGGSMHEPPYGPQVDDLRGTISIAGQNVLDMGVESEVLGFATPQEAWQAFAKQVPFRVQVSARTSVPIDRLGEHELDVLVHGDLTITGMGPMRADGTCEFHYSPEPIPITDYDYID